MKYIIIFLLSFVLVSSCGSNARRSENSPGKGDGPWPGEVDEAAAAEDEVFEGAGYGYRGPVSVQVRMRGGSITEIVIVDSAEDRYVGGAAMEELSDLVLEYNSTDVDAITGATESSRGFLEAVDNAIMKR